MALQFRTTTVRLHTPNVTLNFGEAIKQYVVGITGFNFSYPGGKGHDVQTIKLALQVNQLNTTTLQIQVTAQMSDNGGNNQDNQYNWVTIGVLVEAGAETGNLTLANANNIQSGDKSSPIPLEGSNPYINLGFLSGFNLSYGSGSDHDVQTLNASASISQSGSDDYIEAQAEMKDGGRNSASTTTVNGGALATFKQNVGLVTATKTNQQTSGSVSVDMTQWIPEGYRLTGQVVALLTGYQISYGGTTGNDVNTLGAGLIRSYSVGGQADPGVPTVNGASVILPGPQAFMYDLGWPSNHSQNNSESFVNLLIVAGIEPSTA